MILQAYFRFLGSGNSIFNVLKIQNFKLIYKTFLFKEKKLSNGLSLYSLVHTNNFFILSLTKLCNALILWNTFCQLESSRHFRKKTSSIECLKLTKIEILRINKTLALFFKSTTGEDFGYLPQKLCSIDKTSSTEAL